MLFILSSLVMAGADGQNVLFSTRHDHLGLGFHDAATYVDKTIGGYPIVFAMCNEPTYFSGRVCVSILDESGEYLSTTSFGDPSIRYSPNCDGTVKLTDGDFAGAIEAYLDGAIHFGPGCLIPMPTFPPLRPPLSRPPTET